MRNNNYFESRELCGNLCEIFGLSRHLTHSFTRILAQALVHQIAEKALDKENGRLSEFSIEIPFIGRADIRMENNEPVVDKLELEQDFKEWIKAAVKEGRSPLVISSEEALINSIKSRYNSLI